MRVAAVNHGVARFQVGGDVVDHGAGHPCGHHQPDRSGRRQLADEIGHRGRADRARARERVDRGGAVVVHDTLVARVHAAAHEVRAHAAQSDHSELHVNSCRS